MRTERGRRAQLFMEKTRKSAVILVMTVVLAIIYSRSDQAMATAAVLTLIALGYFAPMSLIPSLVEDAVFNMRAGFDNFLYFVWRRSSSLLESQMTGGSPLNVIRVGEKEKKAKQKSKCGSCQRGGKGLLYLRSGREELRSAAMGHDKKYQLASAYQLEQTIDQPSTKCAQRATFG